MLILAQCGIIRIRLDRLLVRWVLGRFEDKAPCDAGPRSSPAPRASLCAGPAGARRGGPAERLADQPQYDVPRAGARGRARDGVGVVFSLPSDRAMAV